MCGHFCLGARPGVLEKIAFLFSKHVEFVFSHSDMDDNTISKNGLIQGPGIYLLVSRGNNISPAEPGSSMGKVGQCAGKKGKVRGGGVGRPGSNIYLVLYFRFFSLQDFTFKISH